ncbi:MAG: hypothetical protein C4293_04795 [Nitrospiraceae bacterium]
MAFAIWQRLKAYREWRKARKAGLSHQEMHELTRLTSLAQLPGGKWLKEPLSALARGKTR